MKHAPERRQDEELLWYQRRAFLGAAAAWVAAGGSGAALAQQRSNIVELVGDAKLNGVRLTPEQTIQTGDEIVTGPGTSLVFVVGSSAFRVRQNSHLSVERGQSVNAVSMLRLVAGAVVSIWGKGPTRRIVLPTLTAGIRGTGVYAEVFASQDNRGYFCNCYGLVDLYSGGNTATSRADYHQAFWSEVQPRDGRYLTPAPAINHSDEELELLARLVEQRTAWQVLGRKGVKDGKGYMDDQPGQGHPAAPTR